MELSSASSCELYRILDIAYQETRFLPVPCFVYIKQDTHEITFTFDDDNDSTLMSAALSQTKEHLNGMEKMFDKPLPTTILDDNTDLIQGVQNLLSIMQFRNKSKVSVQELEEAYFSDRLLLDGEIRDLLTQCDLFKPTSLCISTPFLRRLFEDNDVVYMLAVSKAKDIFIEYNPDEYKVKDAIKRLTEKITDGKNIYLCPTNNSVQLTGDIFVFYPRAFVKTQYTTVETDILRKTLLKPISSISFNNSQIDETYNFFRNQVEEVSD